MPEGVAAGVVDVGSVLVILLGRSHDLRLRRQREAFWSGAIASVPEFAGDFAFHSHPCAFQPLWNMVLLGNRIQEYKAGIFRVPLRFMYPFRFRKR